MTSDLEFSDRNKVRLLAQGDDMTQPLRLSRALVDRLPSRTDERGPMKVEPPGQEYYNQTAAQLLSQLDPPGTLWVFAAGSLIWNPRFDVAERRAARVSGWRRSFCLGPDTRFRGSPGAPGRMMSLDTGSGCTGIVLRMEPAGLCASLTGLLEKEPPIPPQWVRAETDAGAVMAIAFTADPTHAHYCPEPAEAELADILASSVGHIGTMADYLLNTVTELEKAGIHDPYLWRLQSLVADRLERLPEP